MPFEKQGNVLKGPGIYDMKAGILMMIFALKILKKHQLQPAIQPVIFINSDEETGSTDSVENIIRLAMKMEKSLCT